MHDDFDIIYFDNFDSSMRQNILCKQTPGSASPMPCIHAPNPMKITSDTFRMMLCCIHYSLFAYNLWRDCLIHTFGTTPPNFTNPSISVPHLVNPCLKHENHKCVTETGLGRQLLHLKDFNLPQVVLQICLYPYVSLHLRCRLNTHHPFNSR